MSGMQFTRDAKQSLAAAPDCAKELNDAYIGTEHILLGLLRTVPLLFPGKDSVVDLEDRVFARLGRRRRRSTVPSDERLAYTAVAKEVLQTALAEARAGKERLVGPKHLLKGLVANKGIAGEILRESGFQWDWKQENTPESVPRDLALDLIHLSDESEDPYYEQIVSQIKEAIAAGHLNPGDRLPSVRTLADSLQLAPGTVARAYALLEEEDVVETAGAKGTMVAIPKRKPPKGSGDRVADLSDLLRPVVVEAFHMGGSIEDIFEALRIAVVGVFNRDASDYEFPEDMDFTFEG